jgi:putative ABC transport system permease protein
MKMQQSLRLALKSILSSKTRSALTMLGIIIGVASVIILVSIIGGFSNSLKDRFASMGTNLVNVRITERSELRNVTVGDMDKLVLENPSLYTGFSPVVSVSRPTIKYGSVNFSTTGYGTNEDYDDLRSMSLSEGSFLSYMNVSERMKVCVIGSYEQTALFGGEDPVGQVVKINGVQFTVIGVLEPTNGGTQGSQDDCVYIPYTTAEVMSGSTQVANYVLGAAGTDVMTGAVGKVTSLLTDKLGNSNYFTVSNSTTMIDSINSIMSQLTLVLVGIAAISLLVGGIGIMNIMIVSVTERTREIGIRMSVGAKGRDILSQFLIEAATTSAVGGVIGILLGVGVSFPLGSALGVTASVSAQAVLLAFGVSAAIGIAFGFFPARRASRLNPIDALRFE